MVIGFIGIMDRIRVATTVRGLALAGLSTLFTLQGAIASEQSALVPEPHALKRIFVSGHSLTDIPFAGYLNLIAESKGLGGHWEQQIGVGSKIAARLEHPATNRRGVRGLRTQEIFRRRSNVQPYDTLVLAEGHHSVATIMWSQSVRSTQQFSELFHVYNPSGRVFFFQPWESIKDKQNLGDWIDIERSSAKVWGCTVDRVNTNLASEKSTGQITYLPIGLALTELLAAVSAGKLPELSVKNPAQAVDMFLDDNVHLNKLGHYFSALVTFVGISGRSPVNAWRPDHVTVGQSEALQSFAEKFYKASWRRFNRPTDWPGCRQLMVDSFCDDWNAYVPGKWTDPQPHCKRFFGRSNDEKTWFETPNPFAPKSKASLRQ